MKVYLDDERTTPEGWTRVYWPSEAIELLQTGQVTELSLDHDLGNDARGTGYDVVLWVEEQVAMHGFVPPTRRSNFLSESCIFGAIGNVSDRSQVDSIAGVLNKMVRVKKCDRIR
jgi:hypothetical protein